MHGASARVVTLAAAGLLHLAAHGAFDSKKHFSKVLSRLKRDAGRICKNSELARHYKLMEAQHLVGHHPQLEFFLRTKVGKSASGRWYQYPAGADVLGVFFFFFFFSFFLPVTKRWCCFVEMVLLSSSSCVDFVLRVCMCV